MARIDLPAPRFLPTAVAGLALLGSLGACLPGSGTSPGAQFRINTADLELVIDAVDVTALIEVENVGVLPGSLNVNAEGDVVPFHVDSCNGPLAPAATCEIEVRITPESTEGSVELAVGHATGLTDDTITIDVVAGP